MDDNKPTVTRTGTGTEKRFSTQLVGTNIGGTHADGAISIKKNVTTDNENDLQGKGKNPKPKNPKSRKKRVVNITIAFTATQSQELKQYAKLDNRSVSYAVKDVLIRHKVISVVD